MRQVIITKTYAKFNELSKEDQIKVLDRLRYINTDYDWWEYTKEGFHTILEILGFYNLNSNFSGFYSQGDGASFSATFTVPSKNDKIKDRLHKLKEYSPFFFRQNKLLLGELLDLDCQLSGYHDDLVINQSGRYCHAYTMSCDNYNLLSVARQLANLYYSTLDNEYEFLTSDEAVIDSIESNEYEFDLDTLKIA